MTTRALLACGILSSLLYVGTDVLGAMRWEGYSYADQTISELSAIGSPVRSLVGPLFLLYSPLVIAFGLGVSRSAGHTRALRVAGGLLIGFGVVCLAGPFFPMHLRGAELTLTDTMHVILAGVDVLFILFTIGFAAAAGGKRFRLYSIATMVAVLLFGALAGMDGPRVAANEPTPWVGVKERISVYAFNLWVLVFAFRLMRTPSSGDSPSREG